jgi:hypothetical protein
MAMDIHGSPSGMTDAERMAAAAAADIAALFAQGADGGGQDNPPPAFSADLVGGGPPDQRDLRHTPTSYAKFASRDHSFSPDRPAPPPPSKEVQAQLLEERRAQEEMMAAAAAADIARLMAGDVNADDMGFDAALLGDASSPPREDAHGGVKEALSVTGEEEHRHYQVQEEDSEPFSHSPGSPAEDDDGDVRGREELLSPPRDGPFIPPRPSTPPALTDPPLPVAASADEQSPPSKQQLDERLRQLMSRDPKLAGMLETDGTRGLVRQAAAPLSPGTEEWVEHGSEGGLLGPGGGPGGANSQWGTAAGERAWFGGRMAPAFTSDMFTRALDHQDSTRSTVTSGGGGGARPKAVSTAPVAAPDVIGEPVALAALSDDDEQVGGRPTFGTAAYEQAQLKHAEREAARSEQARYALQQGFREAEVEAQARRAEAEAKLALAEAKRAEAEALKQKNQGMVVPLMTPPRSAGARGGGSVGPVGGGGAGGGGDWATPPRGGGAGSLFGAAARAAAGPQGSPEDEAGARRSREGLASASHRGEAAAARREREDEAARAKRRAAEKLREMRQQQAARTGARAGHAGAKGMLHGSGEAAAEEGDLEVTELDAELDRRVAESSRVEEEEWEKKARAKKAAAALKAQLEADRAKKLAGMDLVSAVATTPIAWWRRGSRNGAASWHRAPVGIVGAGGGRALTGLSVCLSVCLPACLSVTRRASRIAPRAAVCCPLRPAAAAAAAAAAW